MCILMFFFPVGVDSLVFLIPFYYLSVYNTSLSDTFVTVVGGRG